MVELTSDDINKAISCLKESKPKPFPISTTELELFRKVAKPWLRALKKLK